MKRRITGHTLNYAMQASASFDPGYHILTSTDLPPMTENEKRRMWIKKLLKTAAVQWDEVRFEFHGNGGELLEPLVGAE